MSRPGDLALDWVRSLAPYVPGKPIEELERELGISNIVKLASNENPFGPSPLAIEAMQRALAETWLYPDGSGHVLKQKLAKKLGVEASQITLGNGSNDALVLLAEAFLAPGLEAVYSQYGFAVYPIAIQATGATGVCVPALRADSAMPHPSMELGHDLAAMARAINERTRIVFVANPNNPTGTWADARELESFVAAVPRHVLVALDEAYFEYTAGLPLQNGIDWLAR
ncbi:MAG TPA: aminotransferase class I/II-fold pyridoxal phosphate-dependent enzyme, partial [Steroidobacteraceae bacterium]